jgi:very-short-patch-repair endonuclease
MNPLYNKSSLKETRRDLRNNPTEAEAFLWRFIKECKLKGRRFRRQYSVDNFVLDFYCPKERLSIELDGAHHFTPDGVAIDLERDEFLKSCNITVLRFENKVVLDSTDFVLKEIERHFKD